jgi:hypothetical protein
VYSGVGHTYVETCICRHTYVVVRGHICSGMYQYEDTYVAVAGEGVVVVRGKSLRVPVCVVWDTYVGV